MSARKRGTAIVTGGTGEIGSQIVSAIACRQQRVIVLTRAKQAHGVFYPELSNHAHVEQCQVDIGNAKALASALSNIVAVTKNIDTLIHAAAFTDPFSDDFVSAHQIGWIALKQIFEATKQQLSGSGAGRIIAIGSVASECPDFAAINYATAKVSLATLVMAIAKDTLKEGTTANLVSPSSVDTKFGDRFRHHMASVLEIHPRALEEQKRAKMPGNQFIPPRHIAYLVERLLDDSSAFITGENYRIAGGG